MEIFLHASACDPSNTWITCKKTQPANPHHVPYSIPWNWSILWLATPSGQVYMRSLRYRKREHSTEKLRENNDDNSTSSICKLNYEHSMKMSMGAKWIQCCICIQSYHSKMKTLVIILKKTFMCVQTNQPTNWGINPSINQEGLLMRCDCSDGLCNSREFLNWLKKHQLLRRDHLWRDSFSCTNRTEQKTVAIRQPLHNDQLPTMHSIILSHQLISLLI
jgi:hypothetical protein